jgi:DNA-binding response OmpR family regulator
MKILIVEDDLALSDVLSFTLRRAGFQVATAYDGEAALIAWAEEEPNLVLLDLNLPKVDGLTVCRQIRSQSRTPIIILSVRGGDDAVVEGLELGADDYIVKPFSPSQLVARIRAVLRRLDATPIPGPLAAGDLILDRSRNEVRKGGDSAIRLTPLEFRLLESLMLNAGQVLPADLLIDAVWGVEGGDRTMLKQLVYRLRTKIEPDPAQPTYIETVPGIGYALGKHHDT